MREKRLRSPFVYLVGKRFVLANRIVCVQAVSPGQLAHQTRQAQVVPPYSNHPFEVQLLWREHRSFYSLRSHVCSINSIFALSVHFALLPYL